MTRTTPAVRLAERLDRLRGEPAFRNYLAARDQVLEMLDRGAGDTSSYWREELDNLEYLLDASPLVVERLRHHCFHVTGVRVYEYRSGQHQLQARLAERLRALRAVGGSDLLVPESPALGGFGFEIDGVLVNLDTVKYYESLVAMRRGGVLDALGGSSRPVICEIGGGWGGMAYQMKSVVQNATYVIVDLPELFVLSATYLATVFPGAELAYHGDDVDWASADFVFVPNTALRDLDPPRLDLVLNTVSFQEMTTQQVDDYVRRAHELGSPMLYSLNRDRSVYNRELTSVRELMGSRYELTEVPVLPMPYNRIGVTPGPKERLARLFGKRENEYRHVVGRRRA